MKKILFFAFFLLLSSLFLTRVQAQARVLNAGEVARVFDSGTKSTFGIEYRIYRAYAYSDAGGDYYVVFTEKADKITESGDTINYKIKAFAFQNNSDGLLKLWEINDFTIKNPGTKEDETSIWFWTKYCEFIDHDNDGYVEPIVVYGTSGINKQADGRMKILVFYKGKKVAIRHQNGTLDFERNTQVDAAFYTLPAAIQNRVKAIMEKQVADDNCIFPVDWQEAMKKKKTQFDEN
ncbi:MAG: hypothetical protein EAZ57_02220 [Cytophagales bacterium]|nr:MAG: hypothetical protein EAZ67_02365 [Cytophagales bacterium]TAF61934.1 MAG: hypothetical protein EAZ57_02220 [Cytophagales bacterium]